MTTHPPQRPTMKPAGSVIAWLLDAGPAIRWQVLRDLTGAPADEVAAERARVATEGWGARLLSLQGPDGRWSGAAWNQGWDSTRSVAGNQTSRRDWHDNSSGEVKHGQR